MAQWGGQRDTGSREADKQQSKAKDHGHGGIGRKGDIGIIPRQLAHASISNTAFCPDHLAPKRSSKSCEIENGQANRLTVLALICMISNPVKNRAFLAAETIHKGWS